MAAVPWGEESAMIVMVTSYSALNSSGLSSMHFYPIHTPNSTGADGISTLQMRKWKQRGEVFCPRLHSQQVEKLG